MIGIVLTTAAERDAQLITALIIGLLVIAALLALLTFWYWRHTNPRRYVRSRYDYDDHELAPQAYDVDGGYDDRNGYRDDTFEPQWADDPDTYHNPRDRHLT